MGGFLFIYNSVIGLGTGLWALGSVWAFRFGSVGPTFVATGSPLAKFQFGKEGLRLRLIDCKKLNSR